ncbi:MAG TPA: hypothetical protein DD738_07555 [Ruminiclostridium sp.]|nr:hypothetical protein [Ruminiclostridium sp.]
MKKKLVLVLSLIIGPMIGAISFTSVIIPNNLISGGLGGLALLLNRVTGLNVQLLLALLFLPIGIWAFIKFGINQIITASICYILFTVYIGIMPVLVPPLKTDFILAAIVAGILSGLSGGIVLRLGVSNGPESLIGIYLKQKFNIPIGSFLTIFNSIIIFLSMFSADITMALYSAIIIYISGRVTDFIILGFGRYFEMNIITSKYIELTDFIHKEIKRGVTYIQCIGTYELKKNMMVKTLVKNDEVIKIKNHLKALDPDSFIYINESTEVHGRGFSE